MECYALFHAKSTSPDRPSLPTSCGVNQVHCLGTVKNYPMKEYKEDHGLVYIQEGRQESSFP